MTRSKAASDVHNCGISLSHLSCSNWYTEDVMRVELLGVPRERAGVAELELEADTLGQLLAALAVRFPSFGELITADRLQPSFVANLNGDRFVSDPAHATRRRRLGADSVRRRRGLDAVEDPRLSVTTAAISASTCRTDSVERVPLPEAVLRQFLGGSGLGAWLLLEEGDPGADRWRPKRRWSSRSVHWSAAR